MTTLNPGVPARNDGEQNVQYLYKDFTFNSTTAVALTLGVIPAGGWIINAGILVSEAFNFGTNNRADLGTSADDDGLGTDLALGTVGQIVWDELATSNDMGPYTSPTTITVTPDITGTAGTTGAARAWVAYCTQN